MKQSELALQQLLFSLCMKYVDNKTKKKNDYIPNGHLTEALDKNASAVIEQMCWWDKM